jgi:hypothetical protein
MIPKVLSVVMRLNPYSILDVGAGTGKYGLLFREYLDWNYGRLNRDEWQYTIDAVEIDESYITPVHSYVYNKITIANWLSPVVDCRDYQPYDLIFMGDVLEHWPDGEWQKALMKAKKYSRFTLVVCPNWQGSIAQKSFYGHDQEEHKVVLSPQIVGGRCLFASSKMFMCGFNNMGVMTKLEDRDICL